MPNYAERHTDTASAGGYSGPGRVPRGRPRVGPQIARNWRSRGEAQTWRQASVVAVTHTCAFPHPLWWGLLPLTQAVTLTLSILPTGKPRLRDARTWVRSPRLWRGRAGHESSESGEAGPSQPVLADNQGEDRAQEGAVGTRARAEGCRAQTLQMRGSGQVSALPSGRVALAPFQHRLCQALSVAFLVSRQKGQMDGECSFGEMV